MKEVSRASGRMSSGMAFEYKFTAAETRALARFLRESAGQLPDALVNFTRAVENAVYDTMSIKEAEQFYS